MRSRKSAAIIAILTIFIIMLIAPSAYAKSVKQLDSISIYGITELAEGKSTTLKTAYTPTNTAYKSVKWSSSNPAVASVNSKGKVTAKRGVGVQSVTITAVSRSVPSVSASYKLTVRPAVTSVAITAPSRIIDFSTGSGSVALSARTFPETASDNLKWSSSNTRVATVDANGLVTAHKRGSVRITAKATDGSNKSMSVYLNVVYAVQRLELTYSPALTSGKSMKVYATFVPENATNKKLTWSSSDTTVATVSSSGTVKAKRVTEAKTVTITAVSKENPNIYAQAAIRVLPKSTAVSVSAPETSIYLKDSVNLSLTASVLPFDASQSVTWSTSNRRIATVSSDGVVTALKAGRVKITAKAADGSGKSSYVYLTVLDKTAKAIGYRALLIGEVTFPSSYGGNAYRNRGDINSMAQTLSRFTGDNGEKYKITKKTDLTANGILSAIGTAFSGAGPNDVSLFMISSHGDTSMSGSSAGEISCYNGNSYLTISRLSRALSEVPGKVIVLIQTCGSGAAIASNGARSAAAPFDPEAFNKAVISAFASSTATYNVGELRQSKFYVLTASQIGELSWGYEYYDKDGFNYFPRWLQQSVGYDAENASWKASLPADTNSDKRVSLAEAYKYVSKFNTYKIYYYDDYGRLQTAYQHVQVYPANSSFTFFQK